MSRALVLSLDLGTAGCKAAVYSQDGALIAGAYASYSSAYPNPLFCEQRPEDWWEAACGSCREAVGGAKARPGEILAIGLSGQSLALVPLDGTGNLLLRSVPIWSDARAGGQAEQFFRGVPEEDWYLRTGNGFPPAMYTLFKLMWLREHLPGVFAATRTVLGSKDFINHRLTGRVATDHSYASGLGAYNLQRRRYDRELLQMAGVSEAMLPEVMQASDVLGDLLPEPADELRVQPGTPVVVGGVDNACMALGARATVAGRVYCALGSSNWITVCSSRPIVDVARRPYVFDHVVPGLYVSAGSTFGGGSSLSWLRQEVLRGAGSPPLSYEDLTALAAASPVGAHGLVCVPTLAGGTMLEGGPEVRGALLGLDLRHTRADLTRSFLEGVALALRDALDMMRELTPLEERILLVGGGSKNAAWRQILADVLGVPIVRTNIDQHAATLGAAAVGFVGVGAWDDYGQVDRVHNEVEQVVPIRGNVEQYGLIAKVFASASHQQRELAPTLATLRRSERPGAVSLA